MTDIEIARKAKKMPIVEIAKMLNLTNEEIELYGNDKAKINDQKEADKIGKLILVTSIHPTPYGEGKTTISIGIQDGLRKLKKNSLAVLREPSLGPVFGIKGGATGGGYAQVMPMEDINLHFTGDIHAITACNNLLCAMIDNHIFQGNELNIDPNTITFSRVMDMNDRALRNITIHSSYEREDHFMITTASEMMAILCLAEDIEDLRKRLDNIIIAFNYDKKPVYASELKGTDALIILLKDAIKPNLVQTLENNPVIIHGGPFANIAHGCNSVIATKLGLKLSDYVVTEAGFGADLGAVKFFDIKCRSSKLKPDLVVINATIRSLKYNGNCPKEEINKENLVALKDGISNLIRHIENMQLLSSNLIVALNKFEDDTDDEIQFIEDTCKNLNIPFSICESFKKGSDGALDLCNKIIELVEKTNITTLLYDINDSIENKIDIICKKLYRAKEIIYSDIAKEKMKQLKQFHLDQLPVCIAKTQYSFSDNPKLLGAPDDFTMTVTDIEIRNGAGFIVVKMGNIMTMPGLSRNPAYQKMTIKNNEINGLF